MNRRTRASATLASAALAATLAAAALLTACDSTATASGDTTTLKQAARTAVKSYVEALNTRDADHLIEVGGVPDDSRARNEARRILADKGGRDLSVTKIQVDLDMGPDVGSAELTAQEKSGKSVHDTFSMVRTNGAWHLTIFTDRPTAPDKPTSSRSSTH
ncbi:hypothetical protein [Streptomyces sp. NPDC051214]|uniref:hypothetical protein n=1 Tax=Streptomyces sp. NPDC051214 TaxID=3155282 RepID=UPI00342B3A56